jgi:hypothetical protein
LFSILIDPKSEQLAGEYFTDELADLGSEDAAIETRGVWIFELSELDSLSHSEAAR